MRFFHVADVHLGAAPDQGFSWGTRRKEEIWDSFRRLIARAEKEQVDLLLIAGDLFHRQPLLGELKEVNYLFSTLTRTKVVFIVGNHDYWRKDSFYGGFPWCENVTCLDSARCRRVVLPELGTAVYGLSYHSREIQEPLYDSIKPKQDGLFSVLLAHGGDGQHIPFDKRKLLASGFDYIALGHIHKPQILERNRMAYAGALEPLDKNDCGPHGFFAGEYQDGRVRITFVPWAARDYRWLEIRTDENSTDFSVQRQIAEYVQENGTKHIYRVRLEGFRDPAITFQTEKYSALGNIIEAVDHTEPAYNFAQLKEEHGEDVIGRLIGKLGGPDMDDIQKKALSYGVWALLEVSGR